MRIHCAAVINQTIGEVEYVVTTNDPDGIQPWMFPEILEKPSIQTIPPTPPIKRRRIDFYVDEDDFISGLSMFKALDIDAVGFNARSSVKAGLKIRVGQDTTPFNMKMNMGRPPSE